MGQVAELTEQKTQLTGQVEQFESENEQLKEQVEVLSGLPPEVRLASLCRADTVKIGRLTNLVDKDKDSNAWHPACRCSAWHQLPAKLGCQALYAVRHGSRRRRRGFGSVGRPVRGLVMRRTDTDASYKL